MINRNGSSDGGALGFLVFFIVMSIGSLFYIMPKYSAWCRNIAGEAELKYAESTKKIAIETAKAEKEVALLRAEAIKIVGQASKDFPEYRQQEFIGAFGEALKEGNVSQIIYVPTEANIPIIEAGKH